MGGLAYTLGALLDLVRWTEIIPGVIGPHELLHFAVLAGMGFHWWFLYKALEHNSETVVQGRYDSNLEPVTKH